MMLVAYIATCLVPQGFFEQVTLDNGRQAVVLYHSWFKFSLPLILKLSLVAAIVLVLAVVFDYGAGVQHMAMPVLGM